MIGAHDMGGVHGYGRVRPEKDEPVFHAPWEARAFALNLVAGGPGEWNLDQSRHGLELLPAADYLGASYYARWALGLVLKCGRAGLLTPEEIVQGRALTPPKAGAPAPVTAEQAVSRAEAGGWYARDAEAPAKFAVGDRVRTRRKAPAGHTRLPRYVQGVVGTVQIVHAPHILPDASAAGEERAEWLYAVRFAGEDVWGADAEPSSSVSVDAWESYLEPA